MDDCISRGTDGAEGVRLQAAPAHTRPDAGFVPLNGAGDNVCLPCEKRRGSRKEGKNGRAKVVSRRSAVGSSRARGRGDHRSRRRFVSLEDAELLQSARQIVSKTLETSSAEEMADWGVMQEKIRADLKRFLTKQTSRRPLIMPVILEV